MTRELRSLGPLRPGSPIQPPLSVPEDAERLPTFAGPKALLSPTRRGSLDWWRVSERHRGSGREAVAVRAWRMKGEARDRRERAEGFGSAASGISGKHPCERSEHGSP